jgi:uncharacterized protein
MVELPTPVPNADSRAYWEAARVGQLLIRRCRACGAHHFMPRELCPVCWSPDLEWVNSSGLGRVYSFSIVHRAPTAPFAARTPYVVALIDLDEGVRMFANIVGEGALTVSIADPVHVVFEDRGGFAVPQFSISSSGSRP